MYNPRILNSLCIYMRIIFNTRILISVTFSVETNIILKIDHIKNMNTYYLSKLSCFERIWHGIDRNKVSLYNVRRKKVARISSMSPQDKCSQISCGIALKSNNSQKLKF